MKNNPEIPKNELFERSKRGKLAKLAGFELEMKTLQDLKRMFLLFITFFPILIVNNRIEVHTILY